MTSASPEESETSATPKESKTGWYKVLDVVKTVVRYVWPVLGSGLFLAFLQWWGARQPPTFAISAINTLGERNVYEITDHIIDSSPADPITITWGLQVIPTYKGGTSYGEVRVLVKNEQGFVLAQGQWDNLDKDSKTLSIPLDPHKLAPEVGRVEYGTGPRENIFAGGKFDPPQATFSIEVVPATRLDSPLVTDTLVLRNAPWYHYTVLSGWHDGSVDVYACGKNLGGASDFAIVSEVFEIREVPGRPWDNWPGVDSQEVLIEDVKPGQEFTATLSFPATPGFQFEDSGVYYIATWVSKKQGYIQFQDGPWEVSGDKWRIGSFATRLFVTP